MAEACVNQAQAKIFLPKGERKSGLVTPAAFLSLAECPQSQCWREANAPRPERRSGGKAGNLDYFWCAAALGQRLDAEANELGSRGERQVANYAIWKLSLQTQTGPSKPDLSLLRRLYT